MPDAAGDTRVANDLLRTLLEMTEEAVIAFDADGRVAKSNRFAQRLLGRSEGDLEGEDVKDLFYAKDLTRPRSGILPFPTDGTEDLSMAKLPDGSFILMRVRCRRTSHRGLFLLVADDVDAIHETRREQARLLNELNRLNERLRGMLSIISGATLGESSFGGLAKRVSNELERVFGADIAVLYLVEEYGFRPCGMSDSFERLAIKQGFVPLGTGLPTLVLRNRRSMRLQLVSPASSPESGAVMLDLDAETRIRLRSRLAEACSTLVGTPVFSYDRVVAVMVVGWLGPHAVSTDDVRLLDTVADYLSVEFAAAASQLEQTRNAEFSSALADVRELVRSEGSMSPGLARQIALRVEAAVPARIMALTCNEYTNTTFVRFLEEDWEDDAAALEFPHAFDEVLAGGDGCVEVSEDSLCGMWVARHTDLSHGYAVPLTPAGLGGQGTQIALLVMRGPLDRPFDDAEADFLRRLSQEVARTLHAEHERVHDAQIAHALQLGLRNELPPARGVTTASLYISATASAVVGGDFFDLYDLPGDQVVVVVGDVSGKGVEAAAMASLVKTALAAYAWDLLDPASMLASLNNLFLNFSRLETFSSIVVVSIDTRAHTAVYCSGGHPPAMVVHGPHTPKAELELLTVQSPIVGAFEDMDYVNGSFSFEIGDVLYLYTDGTTEARGASGEFFGEENLRETLLRACRRDVEDVPQAVLDEVSAFAGGSLHDDIAMVAVRFDDIEEGAE